MLELYHHFLSTCSQKVRLVLAEKGLDYESHWIDLIQGEQHAPAYVKLNPNHVVPTLVHDGHVLIESTLINEYLDEVFAEPSLVPSDPLSRHAMRLWTKRVDSQVHPCAGVITFGIGTRPMILQRTPEEIELSVQAIPDPARREARRSVIEHGIKAPEMQGAIRTFVSMLDDMEEALAGRAFLVSDDFSLADACLLPYVLRLDHLAMRPLIEARLRVAAWFERIQRRDSYEVAVSEFVPEPLVQSFRRHGEEVFGEVQAMLAD
ncbi:MAG: glutathione S-transferase [Deltaproteobacteria bacterium]|jgi:glutathione S-transferase|nr:glutathione S-transferase [Deltaproteobacteria bacterium]